MGHSARRTGRVRNEHARSSLRATTFIVIDAGLMFPEQELLGVDIVIPDITYLKQNKRMVRAIVLTHAHEDHIGAIPYILGDLNVPVYGTQFTLALVRKKLEEHGAARFGEAARSCARRHDSARPVSDRVSARDAQHHRLRGAGGADACWRDHSHRRLQDRSHPGGWQAFRPARLCALRRRKACSRSSATARTSSARVSRPPNARWWCGWKNFSARRRSAWWSRAFRARSTGFSR